MAGPEIGEGVGRGRRAPLVEPLVYYRSAVPYGRRKRDVATGGGLVASTARTSSARGPEREAVVRGTYLDSFLVVPSDSGRGISYSHGSGDRM